MKNSIYKKHSKFALAPPQFIPTKSGGVRRLLLLLILLPLWGAGGLLFAQQQLTVGTLAVDKNAVATVPVSLTNSLAVSALQFDLSFTADLTYQSVTLTSRKADHTVSTQLLQTGKLRVVVYSATQATFSGTSGAVLQVAFKANANPSSNALTLSNLVLSDAAGTSLATATTAGSVTINGPKAELGTSALSYGRVANGTTSTKTVTIYNRNNQPFNIQSATPTDAHFTVGGTFPMTVAANSSVSLQVSFRNAAGDYDYNAKLNIATTDPEPTRAAFEVALSATAFSSNVITIGSVSGSRSSELRIPITLKNEALLTGAQFEISLPDSANIVASSLTKGSIVPTVFQLSYTQTGNKLRILAYTNDNTTIPVSNGELCAFKVRMNNYAGTYTVSAPQAILANTTGLNVLSGNTSGSITLTAPRLSVASSIDCGRVNVGATVYEKTFSVSNTGNEPLTITAFNFSKTDFSIKNPTLPLTIAAGQSQNLTLQLTNVSEGQKAASMTVVSNDKNTQTTVSLTAEVFAYFELAALDLTAKAGGTTQFDFSVRNDLNVSAIQFDLTLPVTVTLSPVVVKKNARIANWSTSCYKLANGSYRVLAFSANNTPIVGTSGVILSLPVTLPIALVNGQYNITLSNVTVSNTAGLNVVTQSTNGVLTINGVTTEIHNVQSDIEIKQLVDELQIHADKKISIQIFDMEGKMVCSINTSSDITIIPIKKQFMGILKIISGKEMLLKKIRN